MKNKNVLLKVLAIMIMILSVTGCGNKNENLNNKNQQNNVENVIQDQSSEENISTEKTELEEMSVVFKDISFVKDVNRSNIDVLNGKYISADNTLYTLDGKNLLTGYEFDDAKYEEGHIIVSKNYKYGIIGNDFKLVVPVEYDEIIIDKDYIIVEKDYHQGVLDKNYNIILPVENANISIESSKCIKLSKKNGGEKFIYNPITKKEYGPFYSASYINDEFIIVQKYVGGESDYMNSFVNLKYIETYILNITNDSLERKEEFADYNFTLDERFQTDYKIGVKFVEFEGYKKGVFDNKGNEVIPFANNNITNIDDEFLLLENGTSYSIVNIKNETIVSFSETVMSAMLNIDLINDILVIERNGGTKTEYYDLKGNLIYESTGDYSYVTYMGDNKYIIVDGEKTIYLDMTNNVINKKEIDSSFEIEWNGGNEYGYIAENTEGGELLCNNKLEPVFENYYEYISLYKTFCVVRENGCYKVLSYNEEMLLDKEFKDYAYISDREILLFDNEYNKYYFKY